MVTVTIDSKSVAEYLKSMGWSHRVIGSKTVLTGCGCRIQYYIYDVLIEILTETYWVTLRAYLHQNVAAAEVDAILRLLAHLNTQCRRARFVRIEECVILQVEIPSVHFSREVFVDAIRTIRRYSAAAGLEVQTVATDSGVAGLLRQVDALIEPRLKQSARDVGVDFQFDISMNRLSD